MYVALRYLGSTGIGRIHIMYFVDEFDALKEANNTFQQPRSGELRTQKLKSHLVRTQSLNVLPSKPGVGQCIAIHATPIVRDFFLACFYPSDPFTCIFFQNLSRFVVVVVVVPV